MTKLCIHIYQYFRSHRVTFWSMMVGVFLFCGYFASQTLIPQHYSLTLFISA